MRAMKWQWPMAGEVGAASVAIAPALRGLPVAVRHAP